MNLGDTFSVRDLAGNGESVHTYQDDRSRGVRRLSEARQGWKGKGGIVLHFRSKVSSVGLLS